MSATRDKVLVALEQACREFARSPWNDDLGKLKTDAEWACWGAYAPRIAVLAGVSQQAARRVLHAERHAGRVLLDNPYNGCLRWWPIGLVAKLQAERASAGAQP